MQIQPYQADIAERMLIGTTGETIHPDAQFVHTENGDFTCGHDGGGGQIDGAGEIAVKGTGALINAAIPGKDKKKDKEKKSREQQADDYLEEPREE